MQDVFDKYVNNKKEVRKLEYEQMIEESEDDYGASDFTKSCWNFLDERGFLTPAQIHRLKKGPPNRRWDDEDEDGWD